MPWGSDPLANQPAQQPPQAPAGAPPGISVTMAPAAPQTAPAAPPSQTPSWFDPNDPVDQVFQQRGIVQRESGGRPYIGTGGTDLEPYIKAGKVDPENGFPLWPGIKVTLPNGKEDVSTAGGLYQITYSNWKKYAPLVGVHDFSPESQKKVRDAMYANAGLTPWKATAGGWGNDAVVNAGTWNVPQATIATEWKDDPNVVLPNIPPDTYRSFLTQGNDNDDTGQVKRTSLQRSVQAGDPIVSLPSLTVEQVTPGVYKVTDYDGRHRMELAQQQGVDLVPTAIHGVKPGDQIKTLVGETGREIPFAFSMNQKPPEPPSALQRFGTGVADVGMGLLRIGARAPVDPDAAPFMSAEAMQAAMTEPAAVDKYAEDRDARIAAERAAAGQTGPDWWRLAGNVAGTMPIAFLGPQGELGAAGNALRLVGQGAAAGALSPTGNIGENALIGAGTSLALGTVGNALARIAKPYIDPAAQRLRELGVRLLPGQLGGPGAVRTLEQQTTSVPFSGASVAAAQRRAIEDFNKAMYNKVLSYIGGRSSKEAGREGVAEVEKKLSAAYDAIKPYVHFIADPTYNANVANLDSLVSGLPDYQAFRNILQRVNTMMGPEKSMDGKTFKEVDSELGSLARDWHSPDNTTLQRKVGDAISSLQGEIRENLERHSPEVSAQLKKLNTAWAAFTRLREASVRRVKGQGVFTPGDLLMSERKLSGRNVFARGDGILQQDAEDAERIIGSTYPDSGTAGRLALGAETMSMLGEAVTAPHLLIGQLAAHAAHAAAYTPLGTTITRMLAGTGLPATRNALSQIARRGSRIAAPPLGMAFSVGNSTPQPVQQP